jgi:hypothetical protein
VLTSARIRYELLLAGVMFVIGLVPVPVAVYFVGQVIVGPYEGETGLLGLIGQIASDLVSFRPGAWILVLSPYLIVQLLRTLTLGWRKRPRDVTNVTESE